MKTLIVFLILASPVAADDLQTRMLHQMCENVKHRSNYQEYASANGLTVDQARERYEALRSYCETVK